jgi:RecA-family ATPase
MRGFDILDLSATDALFMKPEGRAGTLAATALFSQIEAKIKELKPSLFITDALANVCGGDENIRTQVAQFIALLDGLAIRQRVTIVLVAHPSLSGILSGAGTSGSTHWNNGARGRLYLEPAKDGDGEPDPCLRKLTVMKNNYGPKGTSVGLRWERGRFVLMSGVGSFERMGAETKDDNLFLKLLKIAHGEARELKSKSNKRSRSSANPA